MRTRPRTWKAKIAAAPLPAGRVNHPKISTPSTADASFHLPDESKPVSTAARADLKNPTGPRLTTFKPRKNSTSVAMRQLAPPEKGPSISPAKGERIQPSVKKEVKPRTGLTGTKSATTFSAANTAISERVTVVGR
jgi:hypothetical protein